MAHRVTENHKRFIVVGNEAIVKAGDDNEAKEVFYENLDGVKDYSVYGWARWHYTNKKKAWHLLFRLFPARTEELGNAGRPEDRNIACWVGNGYLHFSTTTFNYYGGHNNNMPKNVNYG